MGDAPASETTLDDVYDRAIALAAGRLAAMAHHDEAAEFDRGARSAGALIRTAMQASALRSQTEKDAAPDDAAPKTLSEDDIARLRAEIVAKLERIERAENAQAGRSSGAGSDAQRSEPS